jgi:hypothetical protein
MKDKMRLEPWHKLALQVLGGGVLLALSFFFHVVAFVILVILYADKLGEFQFVYNNAVGVKYDTDDSTSRYEQLLLFSDDEGRAEVGTERQSSVRTYVSENSKRS